MKKEWIMTEEEKKIKKKKIEENRQKRQGDKERGSPSLSSSDLCSSQSDDLGKLTPPSPIQAFKSKTPHLRVVPVSSTYPSSGLSNGQDDVDNKEDEDDNLVEVNVLTPLSEARSPMDYDTSSLTSPPAASVTRDVFNSPSSVQASSPCSSCHSESVCSPGGFYSPPDVKHTVPHLSPSSIMSQMSPSPPCFNSPASNHSQDSIVSLGSPMVIKSEYGNAAVSKASPHHHMDYSTQLTEEEMSKLNELMIANKALETPLTDDNVVTPGSDASLINVINMTDIAIRRLIKMSKKISGFKNLCEGDQIALLKGGCTELMILRSVMTFNPENNCWQGPKGPKVMQIKLDVLREAKGNIYEEHKRFIHSFEKNWRADESIMLILGAITLFSPTRPNLNNRGVIQMEQDSYFSLLRRYLESVYSSCEAHSAFKKLVQRLEELHILNENHVRVFLDVDPKDVEPLLIEIFDLKPH